MMGLYTISSGVIRVLGEDDFLKFYLGPLVASELVAVTFNLVLTVLSRRPSLLVCMFVLYVCMNMRSMNVIGVIGVIIAYSIVFLMFC